MEIKHIITPYNVKILQNPKKEIFEMSKAVGVKMWHFLKSEKVLRRKNKKQNHKTQTKYNLCLMSSNGILAVGVNKRNSKRSILILHLAA